MKRREFLQLGAGAAIGAAAAPLARAQGPTSAMAQPGGVAAPQAAGPPKIDIYSRHLQWLRTPEEVAAAAIEMGYDGVNLTVRPYPGHVDPEKVVEELPRFVNAIRKHGLLVRSITTNISDADSPNAEKIVATASSLGITHYWWGTYRYEQGKPTFEQLDALKPRVARIAALSEKYKMTAAYHTYSMPATVGSTMWDLLYLLRDFDPKFVGFHYDTGHEAHHINGLWEVNLRAAGPYIAALAVKDYAPFQDIGLKGEGGPYVAPAPGPAGAAGAMGASGAAVGRGTGGRAAGGPGGPTGQSGPGRGPDGPGARPSAPTTWAAGNGWHTRPVPLGTGLVNLPQIATVLRELHFAGPIEIQAEYPNGGAENAHDALTLPRIMVLGAMKRDLLTLRRGFAASGRT